MGKLRINDSLQSDIGDVKHDFQYLEKTANELASRLESAISIIDNFGSESESQHKSWVIDQVLRALTGCAIETTGKYNKQGKNDEYLKIIGAANCEWDEGLSP